MEQAPSTESDESQEQAPAVVTLRVFPLVWALDVIVGVEGLCPFCLKRFIAGKNLAGQNEGHHEGGACERFESLPLRDFVRAARIAFDLKPYKLYGEVTLH